MKSFLASIALPMFALGAAVAAAGEVPEYTLVIKHHVYEPGSLKVAAGTRFKIRVVNEDASPEEFESTDFNREAVVLPKRSIVVYVGPLHAGTYRFFGDFHRDTANGRLIVE